MSSMSKEDIKNRNRELCERFPFLIPHDCFTGEVYPDYDYEYTELDDMPDGWRKAFGEQMCQEIMDELVANNMVDEYRVEQIKEKFGGLRWYDNGFTQKGFDIIDKYENLSYKTCIACGKPATRMTKGWIMPFCDECCPAGNYDLIATDEYDAYQDEMAGVAEQEAVWV